MEQPQWADESYDTRFVTAERWTCRLCGDSALIEADSGAVEAHAAEHAKRVHGLDVRPDDDGPEPAPEPDPEPADFIIRRVGDRHGAWVGSVVHRAECRHARPVASGDPDSGTRRETLDEPATATKVRAHLAKAGWKPKVCRTCRPDLTTTQ